MAGRCRSPVTEEIGASEGFVRGWLCMSCRQPTMATSAPSKQQDAELYAGTTVTSFRRVPEKLPVSRLARNFGSDDSMHRKNLSREARANAGTLKTG